jgi:DNA replication protein DnaC
MQSGHAIVSLDLQDSEHPREVSHYRAQIATAELLVIDDLFLRKLPLNAGDELADVLMSRYEKSSVVITSNRGIDDWGKLLGDVVVVAPLLDRIMHRGHLLKFEGKSWRLKEATERLAKRAVRA